MLDDINSILLSRMNPFVNTQNELVKIIFVRIILTMGSNEPKRGGGYILLLFTLSGLMKVMIPGENIPNQRLLPFFLTKK